MIVVARDRHDLVACGDDIINHGGDPMCLTAFLEHGARLGKRVQLPDHELQRGSGRVGAWRPPVERAAPFLVLALAFAGCVSSAPLDPAAVIGEPPVAKFSAAVETPLECRFGCYEPTVAVDNDGRIYATDGVTSNIAVSEDAGLTWTTVAPPSIPGPLPGIQGDALVQTTPSGRLYYSALIAREIPLVGSYLLESIQVAWSDDAGATWGVNVVVSLAGRPGAAVALPDRQWLGFGPDDVVYMTYNQIPTGIWFAQSDDAGATWSGWTRAVSAEGRGGGWGQSGPPIARDDGRIIVPACVSEPRDTAAFVSEDGGQTFERRDTGIGGCNWFPIMTLADDGTLITAVQDGSDIQVATSPDAGATWSEPRTWGNKATVAPWPLAGPNGTLALAWFEDGGDTSTLHVSQGPRDGEPTSDLVVAGEIGGASRTPANTDFASIAWLAPGRLAAVWAQGDGSIYVATT